MSNKICKGQLKYWDDGKGFGFISPETGKSDVFIHISTLKKMSRLPVIDDIIYYETHIGKDGKNKAVNARIEGVTPIKKSIKTRPKSNNKFLSFLIWIVIISILALGYTGITIYKTLIKEPELKNTDLSSSAESVIISTPKEKKYSKYSCDGKIHCSEMSSCEEARFYLSNCDDTKMDGDGDGIPCEGQWCN